MNPCRLKRATQCQVASYHHRSRLAGDLGSLADVVSLKGGSAGVQAASCLRGRHAALFLNVQRFSIPLAERRRGMAAKLPTPFQKLRMQFRVDTNASDLHRRRSGASDARDGTFSRSPAACVRHAPRAPSRRIRTHRNTTELRREAAVRRRRFGRQAGRAPAGRSADFEAVQSRAGDAAGSRAAWGAAGADHVRLRRHPRRRAQRRRDHPPAAAHARSAKHRRHASLRARRQRFRLHQPLALSPRSARSQPLVSGLGDGITGGPPGASVS